MDNRKLQEAAMAALRFATASLDYLNRPEIRVRVFDRDIRLTELRDALDALETP